MNVAIWSILIAGLMPFVAVGIAKWDRGYDNHNPRDWLQAREGRAKRAYAAHLNCFEAFPLYAAAILLAQIRPAPALIVDVLAGVFIFARMAYVWCYVNDRANARSIVWMIGLGATIAIFSVAAISR
jgi:uncharacterized MAPEG superfamily protein